MPQFLNGGFDELRNDFDAVGIFGDETHGHGGRLPFAIGVVLQEGGQIGQDSAHPIRMGCRGEFQGVFHAIKCRLRLPMVATDDSMEKEQAQQVMWR